MLIDSHAETAALAPANGAPGQALFKVKDANKHI